MSSIRRAREAAGMTQADLSSRIGVTQAAVSEWERGNSNPTADNLRRLAQVLNTTVDDLLATNDTPAPEVSVPGTSGIETSSTPYSYEVRPRWDDPNTCEWCKKPKPSVCDGRQCNFPKGGTWPLPGAVTA